jgi:maleylacetate reductase
MSMSFVCTFPPQRVVFGAGSVSRIAEEVKRLALGRLLVVATPGSGARLGAQIVALLGSRAAALHAEAVMHVPKPVADAGLAAARAAGADGLVAVGGGSAIGLAKIVALATELPILAVPTTYSGSEATTIFGSTDGERKVTGRDARVLPRTILYDPELTLELPAKVSAASGMNAVAHAVESLWASERTPVTAALAVEAMRRFARDLPRVVADGADRDAREQCLIAAWLAGTAMSAGSGLQHRLAHVLGGLGLPHAEAHAIILPHVTRFNLAAAPEARAELGHALAADDPAEALATMLARLPIAQRLRDIGFERAKVDFVADEVAAMRIVNPRTVSAADVQALLYAAY